MIITLNSLSGILLTYVSLWSLAGVWSCCFNWEVFLCPFILSDFVSVSLLGKSATSLVLNDNSFVKRSYSALQCSVLFPRAWCFREYLLYVSYLGFMWSPFEFWPLFCSVQLYAEALFAYLCSKVWGGLLIKWDLPLPLPELRSCKNNQVRRCVGRACAQFWRRGLQCQDWGSCDWKGRIHWIRGAGLGANQLGSKCLAPAWFLWVAGGEGERGREMVPASCFVPREVFPCIPVSPGCTLNWANHSPSCLPLAFFKLLFLSYISRGCVLYCLLKGQGYPRAEPAGF